MRYIKDIPNKTYKIGIYQWNNKYIIKIESGMYEQTYKIDEYEISSVEEIEKCLDSVFMNLVTNRFDSMHSDFQDTLLRNEVIF
jgi:hypothetical protein